MASIISQAAANSVTAETLYTTHPNPALYTTKDHRIYSAPSPALKPGTTDCIVHVRANGICGCVHL